MASLSLFRTEAAAQHTAKVGWIVFITLCGYILTTCRYPHPISVELRRRLIYDDYTTTQPSSYHEKESSTSDKRPIINKLEMAGVIVDDVTAERLPSWSDVVRLYGPEPIISGLETCDAFRRTNMGKDAMIQIGGQFNTGTSFLNGLLKKNCQIGDVRSDVWWKHSPVEWSHNPAYAAYRNDRNKRKFKVMPYKGSRVVNDDGRLKVSYDEYFRNVLPVVTIKDPYFWMQSMCLRPYSAKWHATERFCPNLVPSSSSGGDGLNKPGGVDVYGGTPETYESFHRHYDSLIDYWNRFNDGHSHRAPFPHLVVRYEDLLFRTETVVKDICECAGGRLETEESFSYIVRPTKMGKGQKKINEAVGPPNGLVEAMIKYGNAETRLKGFTMTDLEFARAWLNVDLMNKFHYVFP